MKRAAIVLWFALYSAALAISPADMLEDPVLEARARALDHAMRCVVCQSESVASSNSQWAVDARRVIRQQVLAGQSSEQILDFFVERYGEFVLLSPRAGGSNWLLWAAGPVMLLIAGLVGVFYVRGRSRVVLPADATLDAEESKRLREILED